MEALEYTYPTLVEWSKQEVIDVIHFFQSVEKAYEKGVDSGQLIKAYQRFKEIVPSKSEEKQLFKQFEEASGYSSYHTVKAAREHETNSLIRMK